MIKKYYKYLNKFSICVIEFFIYGLLGWIYEVVLTSLSFGKFVDRGVLNIPICPIYGFFAFVTILIFFKLPKNTLTIFVVSTLIISFLEYISSYLIEIIFNELWWDYSNWQFNLNGRIALYTSIGFGISCIILVKTVHPKLLSFLSKKNTCIILPLGLIIFLSLVADTIIVFSKYFYYKTI